MDTTETIAGIENLRGAPAEEHLRWVVVQASPGAAVADPDEFTTHLDAPYDIFSRHLVDSANTRGVAEVLDFEAADGRLTYRFVAVDGTVFAATYEVRTDGRITPVQLHPFVEGVRFTRVDAGALTSEQRDALQALFARTYRDPDPGYLDHQLDHLEAVGIASRNDRIIGFMVRAMCQLTLPGIGQRWIGLPGLMCVDPDERRTGVGSAVAAVAVRADAPYVDLAAARLATPATLAMVLRGIKGPRWPLPDAPFALHDQPTATQLAAADALCRAHGNAGYDFDTGACIGLGRPIGTPMVEPDVSDDLRRRFARIDRDRGDTLLWINWHVDPPAAWFE